MNPPTDMPLHLALTAWPVIVVLLASGALVLWRRSAGKGTGGTSLPEGTDAVIRYGHAAIDEGADQMQEAWRTGGQEGGSFGTEIVLDRETKAGVRWEKPATLFWVGHDLMWTIDAVLRGASGEPISRGLKRVLAHVQQLGLAGTDMEERLERALEDAENAREMDWTTLQRNILARDLTRVIEAIGVLAEERQPDFDPDAVLRKGPRRFGR